MQYFTVFELPRHMLVMHQKAPNHANDLINMVCVTLEGDFCQNCRFWTFCKVSHVRNCNNVQFLNINDHVIYASKKLVIK